MQMPSKNQTQAPPPPPDVLPPAGDIKPQTQPAIPTDPNVTDPNVPTQGENTPEFDPAKYQMFENRIRANQNLMTGIVGGVVAGLLGSCIWAGITWGTGYQIGFMAILVGVMAGFGVRTFGKGLDPQFGIVGAGLALAGCMFGNLLVMAVEISIAEGMGVFEVLGMMDPLIVTGLFVETFHPMDILFYGLAVYYGYKFSFYQPSEQEAAAMARRARPTR